MAHTHRRFRVASSGPPVVLSVSGLDPTGCAGQAADLKTFAAHHAHGSCVVTATGGAAGLTPLAAAAVSSQLAAAIAEMPPAAVKVGMLATAENAAVVAARARAGELPNLVLDPILDTAGGFRRGLVIAITRLMPYTTVITPNIEEASALVGWPIAGTADMAGAAAQLAASGAKFVVITGGQLVGDEAVDAVWTSGGTRFMHAHRVTTRARGLGCSFSAAIAARLAQGHQIDDAVAGAKDFVTRAIDGATGWHVGRATNPMDHFGFAMAAGSPRRAA
jgi:hydroxymethylpyrimidine/phosphomethylpyrimidine kinase